MADFHRGSSGSAKPRFKKRKPTYLIRREEIHSLNEEIQVLRTKLAALQGTKESTNEDVTVAKMAENKMLKDLVRNQQVAVASAHAMLSYQLSRQHDNPMYTFIHLPKQWGPRRATLVAMKDSKFRQTYNYLVARSYHLDMFKNHFSGEQYEDADENFVCHRFDVIHFRGVKSLKQVFDALVFYMFNMEITVSETLGDITVREDYDSLNDGAYISNHRLVSHHENATTEVNTASFAQHFEGQNELQSPSCGLLAVDSIDEDELHPYDPVKFVRRDVSAAVMLTEERSTNSSHESDDTVDVVMQRAAFMKIYRPSFEMPETTMIELCERISQWPNVMAQTIREIMTLTWSKYLGFSSIFQ